MNKKLAHTVLLFFDFLCIWGFLIGYHDVKHTLMEITSYTDMITFGSRDGFFILGIFLPAVHLLPVIDHIWPDFPKKYHQLVNISLIVTVVAMLSSGFIISSWIKSQVENAGYIYCREASGISALAKSLVYTKDMAICEDLVTAKYKHRK
jgi:hypothetical protein